jgi:hypothetical protein
MDTVRPIELMTKYVFPNEFKRFTAGDTGTAALQLVANVSQWLTLPD